MKSGGFNEDRLRYTAEDIRFTTKGDTLYAIALGWPAGGQLLVRSLATPAGKIAGVTLVGHTAKVDWSQTEDGLVVTLPEKNPCEHACVLKIAGADLKPVKVTAYTDA